ncbi:MULTISPECIES: protein kinase family protein [unclassified Streptomyces]|uniref:protein kinase family protein n=1 Tax=unclassified Streptomyces TaxID=2593676 RepID=UPI002E36CEEA|nr:MULTISPECIES: protein kinase family protein [unclassified Streptomyces]WUC65597.1 protein kinase family protein [Streptomyces sp. NBC_00539]
MAERSTAAVDVADNSGDEPLTAEAVKATADGVDTQNDRAADGSMRETDGERRTAAPVAAPELHSGHKLARRYRLEECVTRLDGFSSWRAMDEKLRRAVGVHLLPADHPRARTVLSAARSSALLGDPRFVQVLDAVEENDLVYVVHEWLPDATELTALLAVGPLEAHEAYQLVSQVSQAMAAAHREGLAHLRLTPSAILRTSTGQYRIRGLAVNAALRGITSDTPQQADTEAIGALLYAALTQRWPYETDAYGLTGLPKGVGLIAPDQVRAGVHRGLGELAMRALANDGATASRQEPACTTPEELAKAVAAMPRIRPPEPAFTAPPEYQHTTYQQGSYGRHPATGLPTVQSLAVPPPPPLQSRTGRALKWGVAALLIAALGLGSWQLADALLDRKHGGSGNSGSTPQTKSDEAPKEIKPGKPLRIGKATVFGKDPIKPGDARKAIDGDADTGWVTLQFRGFANFGNLDSYDDGSGIIVDLGSAQDVAGLEVGLHASGQKIEVRAASPEAASARSLSDFPQEIVKLGNTGKNLNTTLQTPVKTRFLLIHITSLPSEGGDSYRGGINEIKVLGTAE